MRVRRRPNVPGRVAVSAVRVRNEVMVMKIFGLMVLKNEGDIVGQTLEAALAWCDRIAILDNDSDDDTVDVIQRVARAYPGRIDFIGRYTGTYHNDLRMIPFYRLREEASSGDWWCRLDGDEHYPQDPRAFLRAVSPLDCRVNAINLFYEYTDLDWAAWQAGQESLADRDRPITERRRYYRATYEELRFMRHHPHLHWQGSEHWPTPRGPLARRRILMQHFRARDPEQLKARLAVRQVAAEKGRRKPNHHWRVAAEAWQSQIVDHRDCHYDDHTGAFAYSAQRFDDPASKRFGQSIKRVAMAVGWRI